MVLFNYSTKEITAKVVYYGPGLCGKTTNLQFIYDNLPGNIQRGRMLSLATKTDRTLFFDFLPIDLGTIRGMRTRVQLYTVPGQVFYNSTRKLVLKGADGIVFVADSQEKMKDANVESFRNLEENCVENGINLSETPLVLQFNKRDLPGVAALEELNNLLNKYNAPFYESVATTGIGVHETLKAITKLVLHSLREKYAGGEKETRRPQSPAASIAAARPAPPPSPPPFSLADEPAELRSPPASAPEEPLTLEEEPDPAAVAASAGGNLESLFADAEEVEELEIEDEVVDVAPSAPDEEPVIDGLLSFAADGDEDASPASATESFADLAAELEDPGPMAIPGPRPVDPVARDTAFQDEDPLGLRTTVPPAPSGTSAPLRVRPGVDELELPIEIGEGDQVRRYRLRLRITLTED